MNRVVKSRINLLRHHPFFGRLALLLEVRETEHVMTACTDGEYLMYNPSFIKDIPQKTLDGIILHEVLHVALGHLWRRGSRIPHLWNIAADFATNTIVQMNGYPLLEGTLYDYKFKDKSTEQIYDEIKKNMKTMKIQMDCDFKSDGGNPLEGQGDGQGDGDKKEDKKKKGKGQGDDEQDGKDGKDKKQGQGKNGKDKKEHQGCASCQNHQYWDKLKGNPKKQRKIQKRWEGTMEKIAKEKGDVPAGFERIIEKLMPKEDWKSILMNYMSTSKSDFDFLARDRRTLSWNFYIPDMRDESKLEDIVVAIDTSGSISPQELNAFTAEVREILRVFPQTKGWLIDCDAEVNSFVDINEAKEKSGWLGGGGTSHRPVFKEVEKREIKPKVMLCFTDMYTDFPDRKPSYPVLWLVTPEGDNSPPPFGRTIQLKRHLHEANTMRR